MDTYQPFSPSFKSSLTVDADNSVLPKPVNASNPTRIGFLDVFIHQARDIHNICIYHKQDVYAKLYLTTDPENALSTQIINGGGQNPVFNQNLRFDVTTVECSVKCEVWMLSRVRNYLEDQLLGLALVPLSDVVVANRKLEGEFSLSSTDLFHSHSGFVKLSLTYSGSSPEVMEVTPSKSLPVEEIVDECDELKNVEFPDLNVANENKMMVSEYFGIPCENADSTVVEEVAVTSPDSVNVSSLSVADSPVQKEEETDSCETFPDSVIKINLDDMKENKVVQQDIVDMYTKSMQQFTESLAKMKLPMDIDKNGGHEHASNGNGDAEADEKLKQVNKTGTPRVFYGSRAFF